MTRWRRACSRTAANRLAVAAGSVTLVVATLCSGLYLHNLYGPFGGSGAGAYTALGCGLVSAVGVFAAARRLARRSLAALVVALAVVTAAGWVLLPRPIDVTESWVPRANERWSCAGWSFRHYPPGTFDAGTVTYCVGLESRVADG